ncbi:MAG: dicarboxylate/amino acid:cation symporter [Candidatus Sumerlaeaceae bacterium]|nr:dicarboxylate/amino acid:cation symporter [Candidatus Sumerlaeaceae bacterium]
MEFKPAEDTYEDEESGAPAPGKRRWLGGYGFLLSVLIGIAIGCVVGIVAGKQAEKLKPIGDLFLNLLFTVVVPLVFVSISSAVASVAGLARLGRILAAMLVVFVVTGAISSCVMLGVTAVFPPAKGARIELKKPEKPAESPPLAEQLVNTFTVSDFPALLSKKNMLALIVFSMLFGMAVALSGEAGQDVARWLNALTHVVFKLVALIMYAAPLGLGAYFAYLVGVFGPDLLGSYARAMAIYYPVAFIYFFVFYTIYSGIAGGASGIRRYWKEIPTAMFTSLATGSSVATIPANLLASERIGVPRDIREIIVPVGATIHMDGSCLSAILKITFLAALFNMPLNTLDAYAIAVGVAILSGTVMAGIPGGGFMGELLIATLYGFPPEALPVLAVLGTLVDPPATMVNSTGDTVAGMLVARILEGRKWMEKAAGTGDSA